MLTGWASAGAGEGDLQNGNGIVWLGVAVARVSWAGLAVLCVGRVQLHGHRNLLISSQLQHAMAEACASPENNPRSQHSAFIRSQFILHCIIDQNCMVQVKVIPL